MELEIHHVQPTTCYREDTTIYSVSVSVDVRSQLQITYSSLVIGTRSNMQTLCNLCKDNSGTESESMLMVVVRR